MARMLTAEYQSATEAQAISNWLNQTVGIRLDKVNADDNGGTKSIAGTVFTAKDTESGSPVKIESVRILGQLAGFNLGEVVIAHVVPHGKRGQVLAPPAVKDKDAATLDAAFPEVEGSDETA